MAKQSPRPTGSRPIRDPDDFLVFGAPQIGEAEVAEVVDTMDAAWLGTGPKVARFEDEFGAYKQAENVVAVNSCTAALHLSLLAAGIGPGDEVIAPALTFCATVNAIIHAGATPVLADVDPRTKNIEPTEIESRVTPRTKAIIPVHFAGRPCDMEGLTRITERHGLELVEDCAHAVETEYRGKAAGTFGRFGSFSFYATKNVTCGEGGMIIARDRQDADRVKVLALHGMSKDAWRRFGDAGYRHYDVTDAGFKYNMMDIQAAIGIHQLRRVERNWERRRELWSMLMDGLNQTGLALPPEPEPDTRHAYHLFTVEFDARSGSLSRDEFLDRMTAEGIGVGVHYLSIPEFSYYRDRFGWRPEDYPHAMAIGRTTASLPLSPRLTDKDATDVIRATRKVLGFDGS